MRTLLLVACGSNDGSSVQGETTNQTATETSHTSKSNQKDGTTSSADAEQIPEYINLEENVKLANNHLNVIEDNPHKRIIFIENDQGEKKFKSILIKDTGRLKIVEFDKGLIFNKLIL